MSRCRVAIVLFGLMLAACAAGANRPPVDPFPLRFLLAEAGSLEIEGRVVGQPQARDGVITFATDDGFLTAVVVPSRAVLWRRPGSGPAAGGGPALESSLPASKEPVVRSRDAQVQGFDDGNKLLWEFAADGRLTANPAVIAGRVFFGTETRRFYCLKASTGEVLWSRRLQGAPLQPAVARDGVVVVAASNSVVYRLSRNGGSILSWETIPSRIIYPLAAAGPLVLVSSASREVLALEIKTGKRAGSYEPSGPLVAGAVWASPYVVLFVEDTESGRQRIVFLRSR